MSLFEELKRRNVFRVGIAYIVMAWLLAQVADLFLESFHAPDWVIQSLLTLLVIGFPLALFLAWAFELTPDGVKKEKDVDRSQSITSKTGRKLDFTIIALLAIGLVYFIWEARFEQEPTGSTATSPNATVTPDHAQRESGAHTQSSETASASTRQTAPEQSNNPSANSIAVLPFLNMSKDADNEFFSDGVSEEILNVLARIPELKVAARTSAFAYKGTNQNISEIARELKVANILEGSVRKAGDQVRVTAQLIKADDGFHIWSQTYDRQLDNIFAIQDEIAGAIADALKVTLALGSGASGNLTGTNSLEAYEHYLQGMALWHLRTPASLFAAIEEFDAAIAIDPGFARAHAGRALTFVVLPGYIAFDQNEARSRTLESANRALQLDPDLAEAFTALAQLASDELQIDEARTYFKRSIELNPSLATNYQWYAQMLSGNGEAEEANAKYERARDLDPRSRIIAYNYAIHLMRMGRRDEAMNASEIALKIAPDFPEALESAMLFNIIIGHCETVALHGNRLARLLKKTVNSTDVYVRLCETGDEAERKSLAATVFGWPEESFPDPESPTLTYEFEFNLTLIEMGEFDSALTYVERLVESDTPDRGSLSWFRSSGSPNGKAFSCDPRARALFEQVDLPPRPENLKCE